VSVDGAPVNLTQKEFELLRFLMLNAGAVVERETLVREIWGYEYFGESRTVDIHIKNLREKLGASGERIQSVRGVGYVLTTEK
jgi:two-component system alkaline phosphatase synthesis response regulator PhoP